MKKAFEDLTAKMDLLIDKVNSIEKKLSVMGPGKRTNFNLDLPWEELIRFKTELKETGIRLAFLNCQVKDIKVIEMLRRLEITTNEIKESTAFVKSIFMKEKLNQ
ncbi:hypothetical protein [Pedobacter sp. UBA5917]|jgi:hypothetical protein|uniref:hypothetical protein n=1 Tax=Pedobacter sp. UBA5917 TaxID=1947061 RepID=UPI0025F4E07E|nr:hypothetical protein [Pedobacter sp. UBA5917]